jgi:hypothetical protein
MEIKVFVNLLLPVKGSRETGYSCEVVGQTKCALALLEVLESHAFNIKWMPADLTSPVVRVAVERRNNTPESERNHPST